MQVDGVDREKPGVSTVSFSVLPLGVRERLVEKPGGAKVQLPNPLARLLHPVEDQYVLLIRNTKVRTCLVARWFNLWTKKS